MNKLGTELLDHSSFNGNIASNINKVTMMQTFVRINVIAILKDEVREDNNLWFHTMCHAIPMITHQSDDVA
jgi:hypothetical protein